MAVMQKSRNNNDKTGDNYQLDDDFLHEVATQFSTQSLPHLLRFQALNKTCQSIGERVINNTSNLTVDASIVFSNKNPLIYNEFDCSTGNTAKFHHDVRRLLQLLEKLGTSSSKNLNLVNLHITHMRWFEKADEKKARCPALLQKRIKQLLLNVYSRSSSLVYDKFLLRPTRFLSVVLENSKYITYLNLGDIKNTRKISLHDNIFPYLTNLEELVWTRAESKFVQVLPYPHKLTRASITFRRGHLLVEHIGPILNCQGLTHLHLGFRPPPYATRFDMEVLLNSYQMFWNLRNYRLSSMYIRPGFTPVALSEFSMNEKDYCYRAFPNMKSLGFWNSPSTLFYVMCSEKYSFETLQFGELSQRLDKLCSIDSVIESLFTYEAVQFCDYHFADHVKLYLHAMPVVSLDYYIPQLMSLMGKALTDIKTLEIFLKSSSDLQMTSGWLLSDKRPKLCVPSFTAMTHFTFHLDNTCLLTDLDALLPCTLISLTFSCIVSLSSKVAFLDSLLCFIDMLDDTNRFPDLEEIHIQIYGITSFEIVLEHIIEVIPDLKKLSVLCIPKSKDKNELIDLLRKTFVTCKKLQSLSLCPTMINQLTDLSESQPKDFFKWKNKLYDFYHDNNLVFESASIDVGILPVCKGFDQYRVRPVCFEDDYECKYDRSQRQCRKTSEEVLTSDDDESSDEDDSFIVNDCEYEGEDLYAKIANVDANKHRPEDTYEIVESSEDELELLDKQLEPETDRRHKNAIRRKAHISDEDEDEEYDNDDNKEREGEEEEEEEKSCLGENNNSFLDDDVVEDNDGETESDTEEEPFMEQIESESEDIVRRAVETQNARSCPKVVRKKRIIESDSD